MEFLIIIAIICSYSSLSSKLDNLISKQSKETKKKFPSLNNLIDKNISIKTRNELEIIFGNATKGILKDFNDEWLIIETKNKTNQKELYYYRINDIIQINIIDK